MAAAEMLQYHGPPSRAVSLAVSAALVLVWGTIRLFLFETTVFPLTYAIPLLVCVWTRDRTALWAMAAVFVLFHTLKLFWMVPEGTLSRPELWANYGATLSNILVVAVAVHAIIRLRERLEDALTDVRARAEELRAQGEELAEQNEEMAEQAEELSRQTEELTLQGEELASQNEELQTQAEEIGTLNAALERRESLLQTLLDTARLSGTERSALQHIAGAARDLFRKHCAAVVVYEKASNRLAVRALATDAAPLADIDSLTAKDDFVEVVLQQNRTASLNDASLRPDLALAAVAGQPAFRAALCAPVHVGAEVFGAFALYSTQQHDWTEEEFRLAEWLAGQCGRVLQTLQVQSHLRDADRRKSEFLATLSHELRNPLAPIGFALRLIESGDGDKANAIRIMRRQLKQLVRLVDDLLDATRLSSNKIQLRKIRTDLAPIVQHVVEASMPDIEAARHRLTVTIPVDPVWVDADPDRLAQVVTNLLNNATRYTPAGGELTLVLSSSNGEAALSVSDTGIGLERGDLERVFDMFTQVGGPGSGGLGIGLALVRGIVELHGGHVDAHSDGPGRGCQFRMTLPLAAGAPLDADAAAHEAAAGPATSRILLVDDNRDSAEMMAALLEIHGHSVQIAHDAESALAVALDFDPHTAVLDIGLPGMNGYDLAQRLRSHERTRHVRLVALTGWGAESDRTRAEQAGFDAHLTKPAEPDVVLRVINQTEVV